MADICNDSNVNTEKANSIPRWLIHFKGMETEDIRRGFLNNLEYSIAKDQYTLTSYDKFLSLSYTVRDRLIERWIITQQQYHAQEPKRVYYLSMEFLMGRLLSNNMVNMGIHDSSERAMQDLALDYEDILDQEFDAGLGNGGLGRLAACFLDSMATMQLPAIGYGIRYEFGIFHQKIVNGFQHELPEQWLQFGNPWEIERPEYKYTVRFFGKTEKIKDSNGKTRVSWVDTDDVIAIPYDTPIPGYMNNTVNTLRLWSSRSANEFSLALFNKGDYIGACEDKLTSENISKVLYPNDANYNGRELRLKQQYFFSSASLQDIVRRFLKHHSDFNEFPDFIAIQLNDTHPAIAIAELMRIFIDDHNLEWDHAWEIVGKTFAYTNHTLMPEALEKWSVNLMQKLLPRLMEIIYDINSRFLRSISYQFPGDTARLGRMSLIEEGENPRVRMAWLAIIGSHSVNGVARLHTDLLTKGLVKDFYECWPEKFNSKTNGITQRRWLLKSNKELSRLICGKIGDSWITKLDELKAIDQFRNDPDFQSEWQKVKFTNKLRLAEKVKKWHDIDLNVQSLFDIQVKRIHEYKRQLLNIFHCIHLYLKIKDGNTRDFVPRTVLFGGKAAPAYTVAKQIIKFINNVADVINKDPQTKDLLRVHFIPNYRVTLAEYLIPAADLSEQISTAGTEASGTGNMKFALNGALTIGTMDGANIEMREEVGEDNIFIFGLKAEEIEERKVRGYNPNDLLQKSEPLKRIFNLIRSNYFSHDEPGIFKMIDDILFVNGDKYFVLADFESYVECQERVENLYRDQTKWTSMSITNVAHMGKFSSDRTIQQYTDEIWGVKPVPIELNQ